MSESARARSATWLIWLFVAAATPAPSMAAAADEADAGGEETESADQTDEADGAADDQDTAPFRIALGPLSALRRMTFEGNEREVVHTPQPYFGGAVTITGTVWRDADLGASLGYDLDLGYGVAKNANFAADAAPTPVTEISYGTGRMLLNRRLGGDFQLGIGAGMRAASVVVQPNPIYTGHRYLAADLSFRVRWFGIADNLMLAGEVGTSPVFALDNSDAGHGEGSAFGARVQTQLRWAPAPESSNAELRNLRVLFRYRYERFRSQFPVSFLGTNGAHSVDNQHIAALMLEYTIQQ